MSVYAYHTPQTVQECLGHLVELEGRGRLIAGGTDLMPGLESGKYRPRALIDTTGIRGFTRLDLEGDQAVIGAGVTHAMVSSHEKLTGLLPALAQACGSIGSPQVRNVATLAGNVVNAQPAADSAMALVALGAAAEIASASGHRREPVEALYAGLGRSSVDPAAEIVTAFYVPLPKAGQASAYGRISPRNALCLPIVNAAVFISAPGGKIEAVRLALGPAAEKPFRPQEAEELLVGADIDDKEAQARAAVAAARASSPRDSCLRGCADYRKQLIRVLTGRVIAQAAARAARGGM